ncbi:hypothetical protein ACHAWX_005055, partial [Stephanocyclus meneghinianus]
RSASRGYHAGRLESPRRCIARSPGQYTRKLSELPTTPLPLDRSNSSIGATDLSNEEDGNPRSIESDAARFHKELSPSRDHDSSRMIHATTSDFFPPPSLQEGVHIATTADGVSLKPKFSGPRLIKVLRKDVPIPQRADGDGAASVGYRESLDGYKYRIFKTPQLTNDLLTVQVPGKSDPTINQWKENEDYDYYFRQNSNRAPSSFGLNPSFPNGMNDILSSHWWRTLYKNVIHQSNSESSSGSDAHPFQSASMRNRRASLLLEEIINNSTQKFQEEEEEKITARIRVRSVQAASSIDVVAVLSKVFGGGVARASQYDVSDSKGGNSNSKLTSNQNDDPLSEFFASSPPLRHVFGRTNIIIQLSPPPPDCPSSLAPSVPRYVAIYRFGSVVFFNVTTKEASKLLEQIKKHSVDPIAVGFERKEFFEMGLQPHLETATGRITADRAMVRELDMNTVGVVSNIMGQTVALDWHNDTVDELLANFSNINSTVERTGSFTSMERHMLFQVVARNNTLFIDMVSKLGIKDRSDTAWHLSQYEGLHYGMREQFDLDERFRHIEFKLDLIQQNAKFFLEVLHAQKSNTLEWVIIVLISFECVLMCLDMSGIGAKFFSDFAYFK